MSRLRKMIIAGIVIALIGMGTYPFLIKDHFQNHETTQNSAGGETPPEENADEIKVMESILKGIESLNKKLKNYDELDFNLLEIKKINKGIIESKILMDSIEKLSDELQRLSSNK